MNYKRITKREERISVIDAKENRTIAEAGEAIFLLCLELEHINNREKQIISRMKYIDTKFRAKIMKMLDENRMALDEIMSPHKA